MTVVEVERTRKSIIESAPKWVLGEFTITHSEELLIIADHYKVDVPRYIKYFDYSENPNHVAATGAYCNLLRFLTRLANKIKEKNR